MLKKIVFIIFMSIILIIAGITVVSANNSKLNINYGYGGEDYEGHSFGIEYLKSQKDNHKLGIGFFAKETDSGISQPELDYSVPHNDYYYAGTHISEELGMYLIYEYQVIKSFSIVGKAGVSRTEYTDVNISRVTGWSYKGNVEIDHYAMYELGLAYNLNENFDLGLSYNNRRGIVADLSFSY